MDRWVSETGYVGKLAGRVCAARSGQRSRDERGRGRVQVKSTDLSQSPECGRRKGMLQLKTSRPDCDAKSIRSIKHWRPENSHFSFLLLGSSLGSRTLTGIGHGYYSFQPCLAAFDSFRSSVFAWVGAGRRFKMDAHAPACAFALIYVHHTYVCDVSV